MGIYLPANKNVSFSRVLFVVYYVIMVEKNNLQQRHSILDRYQEYTSVIIPVFNDFVIIVAVFIQLPFFFFY